MADVKWIKFATGFPNSKKLKQIRKLPDGDSIALFWVFLICLAGDINEDGMIYLTHEVPYTEEMLANEFDMDINTIRLGLEWFQKFGMIQIIDDIICLSSWEKWQATDSLANIREKTRLRVAKHREKQKLLASNVTGNVTVTQGNAIEEDIEIDIEEDKDIKDISSDSAESSSAPEPPVPPKKTKAKKEKPIKHKYGEYQHVLLTDAELQRLNAEFGEEFINKVIKFFDEYIEEKGYKSQSHNLAIRRWVIDAVKERESKLQSRPQAKKPNGYNQAPQRQYDMTSLEAQLLNADKPKAHNDP